MTADAVNRGQDTPASLAAIWGTFYGGVSAVAYTAANVCLRAVIDHDAVWVSAVKAAPTVIGTAPLLVLAFRRGETVFPPWRVICWLAAAGVLGQLGGNVAFQWALGVIGMALTVPLCMGMIIAASAVLGRIYLNESITARTLAALTTLVAAIWILSIGAEGIHDANDHLDGSVWLVSIAVGAACLAGFSYAVLGVAIRSALIDKSSVAATTFCVAVTGVLCLGPFAVARLAIERVLATPAPDFGVMILAGLFNLVAFVALARALQITTLVYVNALNASQVAMASLAGVIFFQERPSVALATGAGLTMFGLLVMPRHSKPPVCDEDSDGAS